jgi:predicted nucleic acid-binding protein
VTVLLDANVLVALLVHDHVHHQAAENWFVGMAGNFATCPITQGSLMRLLIREGQSAVAARAILNGTAADPRHEFWADDIPYTDVPTQGIVGHRQVTEAYLVR